MRCMCMTCCSYATSSTASFTTFFCCPFIVRSSASCRKARVRHSFATQRAVGIECAWMAVSRSNISDRNDNSQEMRCQGWVDSTVSLLPTQNYTRGQRKVALQQKGHTSLLFLFLGINRTTQRMNVGSSFSIGYWVTISLDHFGSIY